MPQDARDVTTVQPCEPHDRGMSAPDRMQRLLLAAVLAVGMFVGLVVIVRVWQVAPDGVSPFTLKLRQWDFTNLWAGGVLAASGKLGILFDHDAYNAWLHALFSPRTYPQEWSYPPSLLLLGVPLAQLSLPAAYTVWTLTTLAMLGLTLRWGGLSPWVCAAVLISPGELNNIAFGQNGALTATLLIGGLLLAERRPVASGILCGLLTIKPHLGILIPVCLLASRNWRALAAAIVTAGVLVGLTGFAFGWEVWRNFLTVTEPMMRGFMEAPYPHPYQSNAVTVFVMLRAAGAGLATAYAVQLVAVCCAATLAWRVWRLPNADPALQVAVTVCLTLLATPYGYCYDMAAYSAALAVLLARDGWRMTPLRAVAWLWPALVAPINHLVFPLTPFLLAGVAWWGWRSLGDHGAVGYQRLAMEAAASAEPAR